MSVEVLASGQERTRPGHGPRLRAWADRHRLALVAAAAALLLALAADQWQRQRELEALLDQVAAAEAAIAASDARVDGVVAYWSPVLTGSGFTPAVRSSFASDLAEVGLAASGRLTEAASAVAGTSVVPWHTEVRDARQAYVERLVVWQTFFARLAVEPDTLFSPADELRASAGAAAAALRHAVPWSGGSADLARIAATLPASAD